MSRRLSWLMAFSLFFLFGLFGANLASAAPAQVVILRHGEKPKTGINLDRRGYLRADMLPLLFLTDPVLTRYGEPVAIYPMKEAAPDTSNRAVETVTPLAQMLGIGLENLFTIDQIAPLVNAIMTNPDYDGKTVVICWEHGMIPSIVEQFGYDAGPKKWPGDEYGRLWILHFDGDEVVSFQNLPQRLLRGDRH
jgi:hypothetical protein